jgi:lipid-A-disaccharide synthase
MNDRTPVIALVAGEASGDQLGAGLIEKLRGLYPGARFVGVAGSQMQAAGMEAWWDSEELAVMGLFEVLSHFPRLLKLRSALRKRLLDLRPDVFIGIDAPDFNLGLEIQLRRAGIPTIHYVSPTVWAWRQRRVRKIARAAVRVLCLFPFEPSFYERHGVAATYVGHPMADRIEADRAPAAARRALGLDPAATTLALLPGSRVSEVSLLAGPMIEAARLLRERRPELQFAAAMANPRIGSVFRQAMHEAAFDQITVVDRQPRQVMAAADVVLCASGTATLEAMLVNRPLIMTYRIAQSTYLLAKHLRLIRPQRFALPNILAGEGLVPELIQHDARAERMAAEVEHWLDDPEAVETLRHRFDALHAELRCDASSRAAKAVAMVLDRGRA